ncbi:LysE family translocator [Kiloniella sp. b19]|uniref:LysE family translocator n=1 Tax=Kiloniella sp. GXU_MW_B19 TaxID=3141326 RepID=UPI0031D898ED
MTWVVWSSFVIICTANIITPGPAILNTVRRAIQLGFQRVLPTIFGNALGLFTAGLLCAGGVASFVMTSEFLWNLFRWLGIAYLGWLGLKLIFRTERIETNAEPAVDIPGRVLFAEAFLLAVTNPKAILFYVALFPQVLNPQDAVLPQALVLVLTYCGISILSLSSYSALATALRSRFITQERYRLFRIVSGVTLLGLTLRLVRDMK